MSTQPPSNIAVSELIARYEGRLPQDKWVEAAKLLERDTPRSAFETFLFSAVDSGVVLSDEDWTAIEAVAAQVDVDDPTSPILRLVQDIRGRIARRRPPSPSAPRVRDLISRYKGRLPEDKWLDTLEALDLDSPEYGIDMLYSHAMDCGLVLSDADWDEMEAVAGAVDEEFQLTRPLLPQIRHSRARLAAGRTPEVRPTPTTDEE